MYNSSTKKLKAVLVAILAIVLLVNAVLPMTVMGSSKKNTGDYQYYAIKSGDTLTRIAKTHGVTVSDIMTANNLSDADRIISGKVIKIPLTEESSASTWSSSRLSLNLVDANVKDALSAIARNAGYTIIFVGDATTTLTVNLEQMSALKAIDYVTRLAGLSYLKDGNTLMVGTTAELNEKFVDKVVMTKFTLKYITVGVLQTQASALGLSNIQYVSTEADDGTVFVSASPKELAKIQELIKLIDVSSNINAGAALVAANFKEISLNYITAEEFSGLLSNLGLNTGITLASRPYSLYTFVTGDAFNEIIKIKNVVDKPLSGKNAETENKNDENGGSGGSTDTGTGSTTETKEEKSMRKISLEYINRAIAVDILASFPYEVTVHGPSFIKKTIWIKGTTSELDSAENALKSFDTQEYLDAAEAGTSVEEEKVITEKVELKYINRKAAEDVLNSFASSVTVHGPELVTDAVWLRGKTSDVESAKSVLDSFDTQEYANLIKANEKVDESGNAPILLEAVSLNFIDRQTAVSVLSTFDISVTIHGPENEVKKLWLRGTQSAIDEAKAKIAMYDTETYANQISSESTATSEKIVKVTLNDITKETAKKVLSNLPYSVTVYEPDPTTNTLMIKGTGENVDKAVAELKLLDKKSVAEQIQAENDAVSEKITKVTLNDITKETAKTILSNLPYSVTVYDADPSTNTLIIKGTGANVDKAVAELKNLDSKAVATQVKNEAASSLKTTTKIPLEHIDRATAERILNSFPLDVTICGPEDVKDAIWINGTEKAKAEAKNYIKQFDKEGYGTTGTTETVDETVLEVVELENIDRITAIDIIGSFPYEVTVYGPDNMTKKIWLMGLQSQINEIKAKFKEFDTPDYADSVKLSNQFFIYDLTNNTAQEILDRLANLDVEGVTFKTNSYAAISKTLIVYCDYVRQEEIKALLKDLDDATTAEVVYRAVEVTADETTAKDRIDGLMSVHPEIPEISEFKFVTVPSKTGSGSACTTYVKATPEMADYIKGLLTELDSAA